MWALQRRGLAYDQADLIRWETHEAWLREMFSHLTRSAPPGFMSPSLQQVLRADRELFVKMGEASRGGITACASGVLPLDEAMKVLMNSASVQFHFLPLPSGGGVSRGQQQVFSDQTGAENSQFTGRRSSSGDDDGKFRKRPRKGDGKGKKGFVGGKGIPAMPNELKGMWFKTGDGKRICFAYNMRSGCSNPDNNCPKGVHVCCKPRCGKNHSLKDHRGD
jgi:hypothetical protein